VLRAAQTAAALVARGWRFAFRDAGDLIEVKMHDSAREAWREWGRSLSLSDVEAPAWRVADLAVIWLAFALPVLRALRGRPGPLDLVLLAVRGALTREMRISYVRRGPAFWLSPLADPLVAIRLTWSTLRPTRTWRGRTYPGSGPRRGRRARRSAP